MTLSELRGSSRLNRTHWEAEWLGRDLAGRISNSAGDRAELGDLQGQVSGEVGFSPRTLNQTVTARFKRKTTAQDLNCHLLD